MAAAVNVRTLIFLAVVLASAHAFAPTTHFTLRSASARAFTAPLRLSLATTRSPLMPRQRSVPLGLHMVALPKDTPLKVGICGESWHVNLSA